MRLALAVLAMLTLAGCSGGGGDADPQSSDDPGAGGLATLPSTSTVAPRPATRAVQDDVDFHGVIGAGACVVDLDGNVMCANGPSATPPSTDAHDVLLYEHERTDGDLRGGELTISFAASGGAGLSAVAELVEGCASAPCEVVSELTRDTAVMGPEGGSIVLQLPITAMEPGQQVRLRIQPLLVTSQGTAHAGFDVQVTGTLDFDVPA